jgi:hypothetical protein
MSKPTTHKRDMYIDKDKLRSIMDNYNSIHDLKEAFTFIELFYKVKDKYEFDLSYKGFMSLLDNRNTWKLIYAWAIADVLDVQIGDIFYVVELDVNKIIAERKEWNIKYNKKYKEPTGKEDVNENKKREIR